MTFLTKACRRRGKNLEWLASELGLSRNTVKKWGTERPIPERMVPRIVAAFDGEIAESDLRRLASKGASA